MRVLVVALLVVGSGWAPVAAQEKGRSFDRLSFAVQQPAPLVGSTAPMPTVGRKTFGIFTLVTPEGRGEVIRVSVPIGDLVSRAVRGTLAATHRRQEAAARREVAAALSRFASQKPAPQQ